MKFSLSPDQRQRPHGKLILFATTIGLGPPVKVSWPTTTPSSEAVRSPRKLYSDEFAQRGAFAHAVRTPSSSTGHRRSFIGPTVDVWP